MGKTWGQKMKNTDKILRYCQKCKNKNSCKLWRHIEKNKEKWAWGKPICQLPTLEDLRRHDIDVHGNIGGKKT